MLVSRPKKADIRRGMDGPILLLPELCTITGRHLLFLSIHFCTSEATVMFLCSYFCYFSNGPSWPFLCTFLPLPFLDLSSYNPHLSCGLPRFRQPTYFFVSDLFCNLSSFFLTISSPFHPALTEAILLIHLFWIFVIFKLQSRVVSSVYITWSSDVRRSVWRRPQWLPRDEGPGNPHSYRARGTLRYTDCLHQQDQHVSHACSSWAHASIVSDAQIYWQSLLV